MDFPLPFVYSRSLWRAYLIGINKSRLINYNFTFKVEGNQKSTEEAYYYAKVPHVRRRYGAWARARNVLRRKPRQPRAVYSGVGVELYRVQMRGLGTISTPQRSGQSPDSSPIRKRY